MIGQSPGNNLLWLRFEGQERHWLITQKRDEQARLEEEAELDRRRQRQDEHEQKEERRKCAVIASILL